ncbi:MAG: acyltransferase [Pseudomonadota bacterium]
MVSAARRHDIDALRSIAVLLLVVFHTARLFDAEPWHMKDLSVPYWAADLIVRILNVWQMPLLFLLAGISAAYALNRRSGWQFLRERAARLLVPLGIGIFVLVLPQVYVERISRGVPLRMSPIDFEDGLAAFLPTYLSCCYPQANFSWHHLWFLPYLFVYCLPLALVARSAAAPSLAAFALQRPICLFLPASLLIALELLLRPTFPSTHNLVADWANHAHYGFLVLFGWWLARHRELDAAVDSIRRPALATAIVCLLLWLAALPSIFGGFGLVELSHALRHGTRIIAEWAGLLAVLAYGRRLLARPLTGLAAFAPLALPFYLYHQTIIVLLGWLLIDWQGQALAKALAIAIGATVVSLMLSALGARFAVTRAATGMKVL